jgi:hypothetical protein
MFRRHMLWRRCSPSFLCLWGNRVRAGSAGAAARSAASFGEAAAVQVMHCPYFTNRKLP